MALFGRKTEQPVKRIARTLLPPAEAAASEAQSAALGVLHGSGLSLVIYGPEDVATLAAQVSAAAPGLRGHAINPYIVEMRYPSLELWGFFHSAPGCSSFSVALVSDPRSQPDSATFMRVALDPLKTLEKQGWTSTIFTRGEGDQPAAEVIGSGNLVPLSSIPFAGAEGAPG